MKVFRSIFAASVMTAVAALPSLGQVSLLGGGGFLFPRVDNTVENQERGYRAIAGLQVLGENLGAVLQGGYARFSSNGTPDSDGFSEHDDRMFELHLLPKFYLRTGDIGAYFVGGGGPQWTVRETRPGDGSASFRSTSLDMGFQVGFGVEAAISDMWAIGVGPTYHVVYWNGKREFEYAAFTLYLKL